MLVTGDVEVLADEAHVAALGSLGTICVAENPLVGLPVAVAVTGGRHVGCGLGRGPLVPAGSATITWKPPSSTMQGV